MKKKIAIVVVFLVITSPLLWWYQLPPFNILALGVCPSGWSYETGFTGAEYVAKKCEKNSDDYGKSCQSSSECTHQCTPTIGLNQISEQCEAGSEGGYICESVAGTCTAISRYTTEIVEPGLVLPAYHF